MTSPDPSSLLRRADALGDAPLEEKRREDEIRDHGWQVARWTWVELATPLLIERRLRRTFARR